MLNFLVVNDDGIDALGIKILANALTKYGKVRVVAPASGQSAKSHSVNIHGGFKLTKYDMGQIEAYSLDSTPADCTRLGLFLFKDIDIVFSGLNNGYNLGSDIIYSGTVAAAREAIVEDVAGVAMSVDYDDFDRCEETLDELLKYILDKKLYSNKYVLNVNYPIKDCKILGYKKAHMGIKKYHGSFEANEFGVYNLSSEIKEFDDNPKSDVYLASMGYITFTTLTNDFTDYSALEELEV